MDYVWKKYQLYSFKPKNDLIPKLLNNDLMNIFTDGIHNSDCEYIPASKLEERTVCEWKNIPDDYKLVANLNSLYLNIIGDLEYYYRFEKRDLNKWYTIVKDFMTDLEDYYKTLSENQLKNLARNKRII